jgi:polar amino acid transport system substrate-binding protein
MQPRFPSRLPAVRLFLSAALLAGAAAAHAQTPPAPGESPRIDAIRKAGVLRVGVVNNPPWLVQNTTGSGEPWMGSSWLLGKEFARLLEVKIVPVPVSHETKVPALIANQMDIMIGPLNQNAERAKIIDFVTFSNTSVCTAHTEPGDAKRPKCGIDSFGSHRLMEHVTRTGLNLTLQYHEQQKDVGHFAKAI